MVTISVIIPAFTMARWPQLRRAVESARRQSYPPIEVIVCIDNNQELYRTSREHWCHEDNTEAVPVRVIASNHAHDHQLLAAHAKAHGSRRRFGAGVARNRAAMVASGDDFAFLDDDAAATPDWLDQLARCYTDGSVHAVGGAPLPEFETARPAWMPFEFDWVFGCAYSGLPISLAPTKHLIGANMSVRADTFATIGGFHSIDFDDMDMCHRVAALQGPQSVVYQPLARVHHRVPAERVSWRYFRLRCFHVNRNKVETFEALGSAANLDAELAFVARHLTRAIARELRASVRGDGSAAQRAAAIVAGTTLSGLGNMVGRIDAVRRRRRLVHPGQG